MITQAQTADFCYRIVQEFHPERVILFGSYGYSRPTEDSDVDVLVILPFEGHSSRKTWEILLH